MNEAHLLLEQKPRLGSLSGLELILIFITGIGLLFVGSYVVTRGQELTLRVSLLLYALNVISLAGSVWLFGVLRRKLNWRDLGLQFSQQHWLWLIAAVGIALCFIPVRVALALGILLLLRLPMESLQARAELLASDLSWISFGLTLLMAGLIIPFAEELFFRGVLYGWLRRRYGLWIGVVVSALIFAIAHADIAVGVSNLVLGMVLALVYERSQSLWVPVAMHAANNSLAVVMLYAALVVSQMLSA
jgi:membrane protease YdiL (CAAX protease family)